MSEIGRHEVTLPPPFAFEPNPLSTRTCTKGHDEVMWEGGEHCFVCGQPGTPTRRRLRIHDQDIAPYGWGVAGDHTSRAGEGLE